MEKAVGSLAGLQLFCLESILFGVITFLVVLWCQKKWNLRHFNRADAKLSGPPGYPILGSFLEFNGTSEHFMQKVIEHGDKYGPNPYKLWFGSWFTIIISKPEDIQIVLNSSHSLEKGLVYDFFNNFVDAGLLVAPVHKWKKSRRIISPVFNGKLLEQFMPVFIEKSTILVKNLKKEVGKTEMFDILKYITPTSLDSICQNAMGYKLNTQSNNESEFNKAWQKVAREDTKRPFRPLLYPDFIFNIYSKIIGLDKECETLRKIPTQMIKASKEAFAKKKLLSNGGTTDSDFTCAGEKKRSKMFIDALLELNEADAEFSDDDIRNEVMTIMLAGSDTNTTTACFCLLMLAIHQDIQDKVYDEIYEVLGDGDKVITIEDTSKLEYMEKVIKETLRMYPVAPIIFRKIQEDIKIYSDDLVLPKGSMCAITSWNTHHISDLYPNPWEFNPENFSAENVAKRHKYSFLGFSAGPRGCLGMKYAMMWMKVTLSTILRNYSLHTHIKLKDIRLQCELTMKSVTGYPVTLQPRDRRPTYKRN